MKNKGFTLIELLVVVAIIGILAAVGVVAYNGYTSAAKEKSLRTIHKNLTNLIINNKALCEAQGGGEITLYKDSNRHIKHWCNMGRNTAQSQYVQFLVYSGWKNPFDNTKSAHEGYPEEQNTQNVVLMEKNILKYIHLQQRHNILLLILNGIRKIKLNMNRKAFTL